MSLPITVNPKLHGALNSECWVAFSRDREYLTTSATIRRDNRGNRSVETSFYCKHRQCSQHHLITLVKVSCRIALSIFTSADSAHSVEYSKLPFTISRRSTLPFCAAHTDLRSKSLRRELLLMRLVRGASFYCREQPSFATTRRSERKPQTVYKDYTATRK